MERKQFIRTLSLWAFSGPVLFNSCKKDNGLSAAALTGNAVDPDDSCSITSSKTEGRFSF